MGKLIDFLSGTKVLQEVDSPVNGRIQVVKSLTFGTYIKVGRLTQSGGVVYNVWRRVLSKVKSEKNTLKRCLILGLAGGSAAKLVRKYWGEEVEIVGVDLDPIMVELGKRYLGLGSLNVKIAIKDAFDFLKTQNPKSITYDLILVDLYVADEFPKKFESRKFLNCLDRILTSSGVAIFNRLYYGEKRRKAMKFLRILEKSFSKVDIVFPEANVMFVCTKA